MFRLFLPDITCIAKITVKKMSRYKGAKLISICMKMNCGIFDKRLNFRNFNIQFTGQLHYKSAIILVLFFFSWAWLSCNIKNKITKPETVLVLNPSENNPRNSEGDFINLKNGSILFVYTRFSGKSSNDHSPATLMGRYSNDGGKTWTKDDEVIIANEGGMNVMSVSLLRLQNGNIALVYLLKHSLTDCIPQIRFSNDEAKTWSKPVSIITDKEGYFVLNNDRVIQLKDGRILLAVALHNTKVGNWKNKGDLYSYYSDDNGYTWTSGNIVPDTTDIITQEPGLIELKDGRVMMYIRANDGYQKISYSSDQGENWSHIVNSNIHSPLSPATIEKIPASGDWLMVWNNNDGSNPVIKNKRTPLTIAVSTDEGKSWEFIKNLSDDPDGWYCYTAIHFVDDEYVLLSNSAGSRSRGTGLSVLNINRIHKSWIYETNRE